MSKPQVELFPELVSSVIAHLFEEHATGYNGKHPSVGGIPEMPELGACMQVSRLWHSQTLPFRFRRITVDIGALSLVCFYDPCGYSQAEARLKAFFDLLEARPEIANHVHELNLFITRLGKLLVPHRCTERN